MPAEILVCSHVARRLGPLLDRVNGSAPEPVAITIGGKTFYFRRSDWTDPRLRAHELRHRQQQGNLGALFYPLYLWEHWRRGYDGNRFEVEAREAERLVLA